jgi:hypothetical protein
MFNHLIVSSLLQKRHFNAIFGILWPPGVNFINVLHSAFTHVDPECAKKTVKSAVSFGTFGTYERKSCT